MTPEVKKRIEQIRHGNVPEGYKRTKSGIYPKDWTEYTLGDIYTERKEPGNESLPLLMVSIHSGVSDGEVDEEDLPKRVKRIEDKSQYKRAASGDLVFNMMRAWQGAIGTVRTEGMVSPAYIVAKPNELVDPLFMDYYMKTARMINTIHRQSYGVTDFRLRLYWDSFAPIQCVLPPIAEQRFIAEILTAQDKVIALKEKLIAEKRLQQQYLLNQVISVAGTVGEKTGLWRREKASKYVVFQSGYPFSSAYFNDEGEGLRLVKNRDLKYDDRIEYTTEECPSAFLVHDDDVLLGMDGDFSPCIWKKGNAALNQRVGRLFVHGAEKYYIYYAVQAPLYNIQRNKGATTVKHLAPSDIEKMKLLVPNSIEQQRKIVNALTSVDKEIDLLSQSLDQEKQKKKALMQLLLAGIVRVNV